MGKPVSHFHAIGYALIGFAVWVVSDSFIKLASEAGIPPYEIVGTIGLVGVLFMVAQALPRKKLKSLWPRSPKHQLVRAVLAFTCGVFNAIALKHLPMTLFYVIVFTAPMVIALMAVFFLKEHMKWPKALAIFIGFCGVMIAINPFRELGHGDLIGYGAAFVSAMCFAGSVTWLRIVTQTESSESLLFFTALAETIGGFTLVLGEAVPLTLKIILILVAAGLTGIFGNFAVYKAIRHTTAATVSQFHYTQIITGSIIGFLVWGDVPTLNMLAGIAVIILSGVYVAAHTRKMENLATVTPSH